MFCPITDKELTFHHMKVNCNGVYTSKSVIFASTRADVLQLMFFQRKISKEIGKKSAEKVGLVRSSFRQAHPTNTILVLFISQHMDANVYERLIIEDADDDWVEVFQVVPEDNLAVDYMVYYNFTTIRATQTETLSSALFDIIENQGI